MDGSSVSDFSIERILSPQLGHKPPRDFSPDRYRLQGFRLDSGNLRPPAPVPVPVPAPGFLPYGAMSFGEAAFCPYGAGFHRGADFTGLYPNSGVFVHFSSREAADAPPLPGYHGYHHHHHHHVSNAAAQPQPRQKARMRTVFTDGQTKQLEALFALTDYPAAEARAEVSRSSGLSEETVRVWFKNRRARRKRQGSGSKVKSPEKMLFTSFL
ncbi:dharma [Scophthalmus maximus]|uniref:dharma n=1 Tax=Scophthalmus maximus TaxID=52904 RepID=UPI0015E0C0CA|nr:dharma [Scophthalmus maximus]